MRRLLTDVIEKVHSTKYQIFHRLKNNYHLFSPVFVSILQSWKVSFSQQNRKVSNLKPSNVYSNYIQVIICEKFKELARLEPEILTVNLFQQCNQIV